MMLYCRRKYRPVLAKNKVPVRSNSGPMGLPRSPLGVTPELITDLFLVFMFVPVPAPGLRREAWISSAPKMERHNLRHRQTLRIWGPNLGQVSQVGELGLRTVAGDLYDDDPSCLHPNSPKVGNVKYSHCERECFGRIATPAEYGRMFYPRQC